MSREPWLVAVLLLAAATARAADPVPGAYCPLPEGDEPPECLQPATAEYGEFFRALEDPDLDEAGLEAVEAGLAARRLEALSSLAYGYLLISRRAATQENVDPAIVARLERWNAALGTAWAESEADPSFRDALRAAASDLEAKAPAVRLRCTDAEGNVGECESTAQVAAAMRDVHDRTGMRGALLQLMERIGTAWSSLWNEEG